MLPVQKCTWHPIVWLCMRVVKTVIRRCKTNRLHCGPLQTLKFFTVFPFINLLWIKCTISSEYAKPANTRISNMERLF